MSGSLLTRRVDVDALERLGQGPWQHKLSAQLHAGMHLVTMYGAAAGDQIELTSVVLTKEHELDVAKTRVTAAPGLHELTTEHPTLHCFERELHEQFGVRVAGHPWLKPVRYEDAEQADMRAYPFYEIEGKEVHEVQVGPIHAGVIEPGAFRFMCHGELVHHLEIQLGYQHRGVERLLTRGDLRRQTPLVETIAGDSSIAHAWAHCAVVESLTRSSLTLECEVVRAFALELERVAMHLATLAGISADIGFLQGAAAYGRLRTTAINTTMQLCGSRFGRGALRPGGVRMRLPKELHEGVRKNIALIREDVALVNDRFSSSRLVQNRLRSVGVLRRAHAEALGVVGLAARASGIERDTRSDSARGAYAMVPLSLASTQSGDCWARACMRIAELDASLSWLLRALDHFPGWEAEQHQIGALAPGQLAIAVAEGFRGEVVHVVETGEAGEVLRYKVQDPSFRNWMGLAIAMRGGEISDFPVCNKSFDLSYCGHDL